MLDATATVVQRSVVHQRSILSSGIVEKREKRVARMRKTARVLGCTAACRALCGPNKLEAG